MSGISHRIALMRESSAPQPRVSLKELLPNIKGKQQPRKRHRPKQSKSPTRPARALVHWGMVSDHFKIKTRHGRNESSERLNMKATP